MRGDPMTFNEEYSSLLLFFRWALKHSFDGCDIDGGDAMDKAVQLGLAKYEPYNPAKHGLSTHCVEGDQWCQLNMSLL